MSREIFYQQNNAYIFAASVPGADVSFRSGNPSIGPNGTRIYEAPESKPAWIVNCPATVGEVDNEITQGILSCRGSKKRLLSLQQPTVVLDPIQKVADKLNDMMAGSGYKAAPFCDKDRLIAGLSISFLEDSAAAVCFDAPLFHVEPDSDKAMVCSVKLLPLPSCMSPGRTSVIQLVAYQLIRARLANKPAPETLSELTDRVNHDISHLSSYGICPALACILLHGNAPLLLHAELDYALEKHMDELRRDGISAIGEFHFPPRDNLKSVPADAFQLSVQPKGNSCTHFWSILPPTAARRKKVPLFNLAMEYHSDDVPQYLEAVYLRNWYDDLNNVVDVPLVDAVRFTWRALLLMNQPQVDAVKTINAAVKVLGVDGVSDLIKAMKSLNAASVFLKESPGQKDAGVDLAALWAAAADSADQLMSSLPDLKKFDSDRE